MLVVHSKLWWLATRFGGRWQKAGKLLKHVCVLGGEGLFAAPPRRSVYTTMQYTTQGKLNSKVCRLLWSKQAAGTDSREGEQRKEGVFSASVVYGQWLATRFIEA